MLRVKSVSASPVHRFCASREARKSQRPLFFLSPHPQIAQREDLQHQRREGIKQALKQAKVEWEKVTRSREKQLLERTQAQQARDLAEVEQQVGDLARAGVGN